MLRKPTGTRLIGANDSDYNNHLKVWGDQCLSTGKWGPEVHEELSRTLFRVMLFWDTETSVIGYASVWADGDPINQLNGNLWFDHLVNIKAPIGERVSVQPLLYEEQIKFVRTQDPSKRIFRAPFDPRVVKFSEERGWVQVRPESEKAPNGVYELPRLALMSHA